MYNVLYNNVYNYIDHYIQYHVHITHNTTIQYNVFSVLMKVLSLKIRGCRVIAVYFYVYSWIFPEQYLFGKSSWKLLNKTSCMIKKVLNEKW